MTVVTSLTSESHFVSFLKALINLHLCSFNCKIKWSIFYLFQKASLLAFFYTPEDRLQKEMYYWIWDWLEILPFLLASIFKCLFFLLPFVSYKFMNIRIINSDILLERALESLTLLPLHITMHQRCWFCNRRAVPKMFFSLSNIISLQKCLIWWGQVFHLYIAHFFLI